MRGGDCHAPLNVHLHKLPFKAQHETQPDGALGWALLALTAEDKDRKNRHSESAATVPA